VRLGHHYFQREQYHHAAQAYHRALELDDSLDDVRHALGALQLAQGKFLEAQYTWKQAAETMQQMRLDRSIDHHEGICLQWKKQQAYHYFQSLSTDNKTTALSSVASHEYQSKAYFDNQCFVTPMLDETTCRRVIEIATSNGKWTTGRHYAVPTNDIPVHDVPELLAWFYPWMEQEMEPLLKKQFLSSSTAAATKTAIGSRRFFEHDAFFVRYQGDGETNHLPCHFDECTHSFVIGLNDDFEGGGTYFHDYNTVLSPRIGDVVTFKGDSLKHGGDAVTRGTRYILAVFLYLDKVSLMEADTGKRPMLQKMFEEAKKPKTEFSFGFTLES